MVIYFDYVKWGWISGLGCREGVGYACSRKSSVGLMWTPSILHDLFGGRYLIWVPPMNVMELICSCSMVWLLWLRGFP